VSGTVKLQTHVWTQDGCALSCAFLRTIRVHRGHHFMLSLVIDMLPTSVTCVFVFRHGGTLLNNVADLMSLKMSLRGAQPHERAAIIKALASWRKR
jgi:hypothetical protein